MKRKEKGVSARSVHQPLVACSVGCICNASAAHIEAPGHTPDALLPATHQVAGLVEVFVVHVAVVVGSCIAIVAKETLHVKELASGLLRADFLTGFVGFAVFSDRVGERLGSASVEV